MPAPTARLVNNRLAELVSDHAAHKAPPGHGHVPTKRFVAHYHVFDAPDAATDVPLAGDSADATDDRLHNVRPPETAAANAVNHPIEIQDQKTDSGSVNLAAPAVTLGSGPDAKGGETDAPLATRSLSGAGPPPSADDGSELVMLKYADVSEVVGVLGDGASVKSNDTFVPREPGFGSTSLTGGTYAPAPTVTPNSDHDPVGQSVAGGIGVDRRLNAIWLKGTPDHIARLKAQIALIDVPVDSVILDAEIVELDENGASALGINFVNANGQLGVATAQSGQFIPSGTSASAGGRLNGAGTAVGGSLSSFSLQAALYAQINKGRGKIVSRPRIAAQSGGSAKIVTGEALPILTAITLSGVNGVSQQVQYVNVGVTLQIAPRISADGYVTSHVFCVVSSETGTSQGYPKISQREAETMVSVKDGETFVIGGLTQDSLQHSDSKVPGLGDIPLIGSIFHKKSVTRQKTELYIVVTPHVIRHVSRDPPTAEVKTIN